MPKKGKAKNTKNKAKHSLLMARKKNRSTKEALTRKERLKAIMAASKEKNDRS